MKTTFHIFFLLKIINICFHYAGNGVSVTMKDKLVYKIYTYVHINNINLLQQYNLSEM